MTMDLYHIQGWFSVYHPAFQADPFVHWSRENMDFLLGEDAP